MNHKMKKEIIDKWNNGSMMFTKESNRIQF